MVGTSVSENTTLYDLLRTTGSNNGVRLITHGGYPIEHWYTLQRALASGNVKIVLWEIYRNYTLPEYNQFPSKNTFPVYLYNQSIFDDWRYALNHSVVRSSIALATGILNWDTNLGTLNSWQDKAIRDNRYVKWNMPDKLQIQDSMVVANEKQWQNTTPDWSQAVPVFDEYIQPLVMQYPDVKFVFFTPPVNLARHSADLGASLSGQLVLREKLAELSTQANNVSVYAFDLFLPIVSDMAWYKDAGHYSAPVNQWMLDKIAADDPRFRLTPLNSRAMGNELWERALNYRVFSSCVDTPTTCGHIDLAALEP